MAKQIKETPILAGKDAIEFRRKMVQVETKKLSEDIVNKIRTGYERLKAIEVL